jgi:tryptophan-rich sensory protein
MDDAHGRTTRMTAWLPILVAGGCAVLVAAIGGTVTEIGPWYRSLNKPWFQPPDWLFGPAWTVIFALAALSAAQAWRDAPNQAAREWLIGLFALNGFLNILWSLLFFKLRRPDWALFEVVLLWASILLLIVVLGRYSRLGAALLVPYLLWVSFAAYLNLAIVRLNAPFSP